MLNYPNAVRSKNSECGWIYLFCPTGAAFRSLSLSFRLWIPQVRGQPHGSSSPVILILSDVWCEVQADEILPWDSVIHLFFCLPRFQCPYTSAWRSGHRLVAGHVPAYYFSLDSRILSVMQETPTAWRMSSFLFLPFCVIPSIYRSILI